ncbi:MAG TPA: alpha/beta fold hydrolase [Thermoleophilaceae bacterium]
MPTTTAPKRRTAPKPKPKPRARSLHAAPAIERVEVALHGHRVNFNIAGDGPPVVLIHGVAGRAAQWDQAMVQLADTHTVIAPDLLGHGESAKPRGDYSLGAFAAGVRDLLVGLDMESATVVGHSLGGGIAMQFAYQFPERCQRLVLVSSGGLGNGVHPMLRAATLPGSELVLPLIAHTRLLETAAVVPRALGALGFRAGPDMTEIARGYQSLSNAEARNAFIQTVRAVIDLTGQRVDASDRLYLSSKMPTLIVWGERDRIIPVGHAHAAHAAMPGSHLELFEESGHFPQLDDPLRFGRVLSAFLSETEPAKLDTKIMRELVLDRDPDTAAALKRVQRKRAAR